MSHFNVVVVGDNIKEQLAPYHEFECTGFDDEYVQDIDITDEVQGDIDDRGFQEGLEWHDLEDRQITVESDIDKGSTHKFGWALIKDGKLVKAVRRSNPNKKWDWYQIGGRWTGFFPLKPGATDSRIDGHADVARLKDIDFEKARRDKEKESREIFTKWKAIIDQYGIPESWSSIRDTGINIDKARELYNKQPAIKASHELSFIHCPVKLFGTDEDIYVAKQVESVLVPYVYIIDGQWYEKGTMGWWGMSHNNKDQKDWNSQYHTVLDSLDPDTVLTVVDCHI